MSALSVTGTISIRRSERSQDVVLEPLVHGERMPKTSSKEETEEFRGGGTDPSTGRPMQSRATTSPCKGHLTRSRRGHSFPLFQKQKQKKVLGDWRTLEYLDEIDETIQGCKIPIKEGWEDLGSGARHAHLTGSNSSDSSMCCVSRSAVRQDEDSPDSSTAADTQ